MTPPSASLREVELQCLARQQVSRDRIGTEGVQDDQPVAVLRRVSQP